MQLIDINYEFFSCPDYADNFTLEDLVWTLEQLSQYLELSNA
jgi:hypothetical protein